MGGKKPRRLRKSQSSEEEYTLKRMLVGGAVVLCIAVVAASIFQVKSGRPAIEITDFISGERSLAEVEIQDYSSDSDDEQFKWNSSALTFSMGEVADFIEVPENIGAVSPFARIMSDEPVYSGERSNAPMGAKFRSFRHYDLTMYWLSPTDGEVYSGGISALGYTSTNTYVGHTFIFKDERTGGCPSKLCGTPCVIRVGCTL